MATLFANNVGNLDQVLSALSCYIQSSRVRQDVYSLLRQIPSLNPTCGTFAHNDGRTSTLLNLEGTIPIFYRNNQYNIPIEMWLVENYPVAAPVCFVRPTPDMMVKPGHPHVNPDGFVSIPYLSEWRQDFTLIELIAHMCSIFGNMPPVFRRGANTAPQRQQGYGMAATSVSPFAQTGGYYDQNATANNFNPSASVYTPAPSNFGAPAAFNPAASASPYSAMYQQQNMYDAGRPQAQQAPPPAPVIRHEDRVAAVKLEVTRKAQEEMDKQCKRVRDSIDLQLEHQLSLTQSRENVERGIQSLEFLRDDLKRALNLVSTQCQDAQQWLDVNESKDTVDPDTILKEADPLSRQLIVTLAEHQAIEDALYYMDRALSGGTIQLAIFLKEVRKLAKQQFMCEALLQKIVQRQQQQATPSYQALPHQ